MCLHLFEKHVFHVCGYSYDKHIYADLKHIVKNTQCFKNVVVNFLQQLHQLLTDFEHYFTVGNKNKLSTN